MGAVYLAENIHAEMSVALKVLNKRASKDPVLLKRFEEERRIISKLRHPNILKLLDSFHTDKGELVVVIEYVNGVTLEERILSEGISPKETLYILGEVFDALSEAHEAKIVHRDLKPSNLMLEQVGDRLVIKVLDFGIAKTLSSTGMTNTGITLGTPAYMSPEQVQGLQVDDRSDLYSMGCVAYQCLAGRPPFEGENPFSIIRQHIKDDPLKLTAQLPALDVSAELQAFVFRLLAKEPKDRYPDARSARDVARALAASASAEVRRPQDSSIDIADAPTMAPSSSDKLASEPTSPETPSQPGAILVQTPPHGVETDTLAATGRSKGIAIALVAMLLSVGIWLLFSGPASTPKDAPVPKDSTASNQIDDSPATAPKPLPKETTANTPGVQTTVGEPKTQPPTTAKASAGSTAPKTPSNEKDVKAEKKTIEKRSKARKKPKRKRKRKAAKAKRPPQPRKATQPASSAKPADPKYDDLDE